MRTEMPQRRVLLFAACLLVVACGLALTLWIAFGGRVPLQAKGYRVTVVLPNSQNLFGNADVRVAGVTIGKVVDVRRSGDRAHAEIEIQRRFAPLPVRTQAIVRTKSLLGEPFLQLALDGGGGPPIPDGGTIPLTAVVAAQNLDSALSTFDPATRARLRGLLHGVDTALDGKGGALNTAIGWAAPATRNLRAAVTTLDAQRDDIDELLGGAAAVLQTAGRRSGQVDALVRASSDVLATTAHHDRDLTRTLEALPGVLARLRAASGEITGFGGDLHRAMRTLRPITPAIAPALDAVAATAPTLQTTLTSLRPLLRATHRGLPPLRRTLKALAPAAAGTYPALREVIPVTELLSMNRRSLVGVLANVASALNGKVVLPNGTVASYATGMPTVWNEAVIGYKRKLPTNRSNPYPRPDSAGDIEGLGLAAFDCRNTGNPLTVPPLGAAPPCRLQGPWTIDGRSAIFPNLKPAAP